MAVSETDENQDNYFEGVEKLLEIWFKGCRDPFGNSDLRKIPRDQFERMLKAVRCEVISFSSNDKVDAYVLSESSMFISERRFILKTCGTTTPLQCLQPLMKLVYKYTNYTDIDDLFYSRKNFKKPELQKHPHQTFEDEVEYLNTFFDNGVGLRLGQNEADCWYLYTLCNGDPKVNEQLETDQTLELLMTELDPKVMAIFHKKVCSSPLQATQVHLKSGIDTILPHMKIDDYLFDPCGYSMNGIGKDGSYMTMHITPEEEFSYVSFETNARRDNYEDLIRHVVQLFNPGKLVVTLFSNQDGSAGGGGGAGNLPKELSGMQLRDTEACHLRGYNVGFAFYSRFPS